MWCKFVSLSVMIKKIFYSIILSSYEGLSISVKLQYFAKLIITFSPIAFILDSLGFWFEENKMFFSFIIYTLIVNIAVGVWFHLKNKTFKWEEFLKKNSTMLFVIMLAYPILEFMRLIAGENIAGEIFKITIQIATLLYPASKILKNLYILSNKQYPPSFLMDKLYKFEQEGDLNDLFKKE